LIHPLAPASARRSLQMRAMLHIRALPLTRISQQNPH
jgi:hypothetical protein